MTGLSGRPLKIFIEENTNFLTIMKTEHIKNTGQIFGEDEENQIKAFICHNILYYNKTVNASIHIHNLAVTGELPVASSCFHRSSQPVHRSSQPVHRSSQNIARPVQ